MKKVLLASFLLVAVACGAPAESVGPVPETTSSTTSAPSSSISSSGQGETTTTAPGETATTSDRQKAPDFTLELGDGGSYTLSDGEKPVYLVFWAEW